ncbi:MAG: DUF3592 domain-containing protein [Planctomycetes bacterium]|nr:DUF3592 domain-containing protein [Planctomycetota bacterium]
MDWREVSGILKIPGREIQIQSSGAARRRVVCEKCGQEYFYVLKCSVVATARSVLFLENELAEERATRAADEQLEEALANQISPIPCPQCGWYQADMVAEIRESYGQWMIFAGIGAFFCMCASFVGTAATHTGDGPHRFSNTVRIVWACLLIFFIVLTATLFWGRRVLSARYDPNQTDADERRRLGKALAFAAEADGATRARDRQVELQTQIAQEAELFAKSEAIFSSCVQIAVPLGLGIMCLWFAFDASSDARLASISVDWPRTPATIDVTGIDTRRQDGKEFYIPVVHYSYTVDGRGLKGMRIQIPEPTFRNRQQAEALIVSLQRKRDLTASYDPRDPHQVVLTPGAPESLLSKARWLAGLGAIGLIAAVVMMVMCRRRF